MSRKRRYDWLIVGSGLYGATFAYMVRRAGKRCLVIERRAHLGGNVYCEKVEGINVHKYGAHIFHTSDAGLWRFVNSLVPFNRFVNAPVANCGGRLYNLPFNMNTFYEMWGTKTPDEAVGMIELQRKEVVERLRLDGAAAPRNLEEQALMLVGRDIYETLVKGYTEKQWGRPCRALPPGIIRRLPVRLSFDNNYFDDTFQGIPEGGYNTLVDKLLAGIETRTNTDFFIDRHYWEGIADRILYTGPIDRFFCYSHGHLQYRTLRFEWHTLDLPNYQGCAVMNFTSSDVPYTRIIEHKHFESFGAEVYDNGKTVVSKEYPCEWRDGLEPFYPIGDNANSRLYSVYREMARLNPNVVYGGRLAEYRYYDMAPTMKAAMREFHLHETGGGD